MVVGGVAAVGVFLEGVPVSVRFVSVLVGGGCVVREGEGRCDRHTVRFHDLRHTHAAWLVGAAASHDAPDRPSTTPLNTNRRRRLPPSSFSFTDNLVLACEMEGEFLAEPALGPEGGMGEGGVVRDWGYPVVTDWRAARWAQRPRAAQSQRHPSAGFHPHR